ncbi:class I SAM-dependent methyltransferase [Streptomyces sp. SBT349]|uniref:class I SAM-dependent methyltransferase n=1 Tax=Streptomyces sp. SBT349 TaxID=1580539 RepID=UPI00066C38D8|nr:class I SAM-dependent methyltransferase [Streptomyces sp. SBT349]
MVDWQGWQRSWDRQQEWYLPDREERFRVMLDAVEALVGDKPRVLDLACGTGSISGRLLRRFPGAVSTGVDLDPALLAIARGTFVDEQRVSFVTADLTDPAWAERLPYDSYDAVLTATALHWLTADALGTLYGRLATLVRPGGVFLNADHMPDASTPRITEAERAFTRARQARERGEGVQDWAQWWQAVAAAPELAELAAERFRLIGDPTTGDHSEGQAPSAGWHLETLRSAGFAEARLAWTSLTDSVVLALR